MKFQGVMQFAFFEMTAEMSEIITGTWETFLQGRYLSKKESFQLWAAT